MTCLPKKYSEQVYFLSRVKYQKIIEKGLTLSCFNQMSYNLITVSQLKLNTKDTILTQSVYTDTFSFLFNFLVKLVLDGYNGFEVVNGISYLSCENESEYFTFNILVLFDAR